MEGQVLSVGLTSSDGRTRYCLALNPIRDTDHPRKKVVRSIERRRLTLRGPPPPYSPWRIVSSDAVGWAFRHSPYTGVTFQVHLAISDSVNDQNANEFWLTKERCAEKARVTTKSVQRALAVLVEDGFLEVLKVSTGREATRYRFLFVKDAPVVYEARWQPTGTPRPGSPTGTPATSNGDTSDLQRGHQFPKPGRIRNEPKEPKEPKPVVEVFEAWKTSAEKTDRTLLDPGRTRLITAALKGYPLEDVLDAVRGWKHSPFHRGENPEGKVHNDLSLLLRDSAHIERFRDYARKSRSRPTKAVVDNTRTFANHEEFKAWKADQK